MGKEFAPRISKRQRDTKDLARDLGLNQELFRINDEKLLRGAKLQDVKLADITVRAQVRTKFNDQSLKELAENIKVNGLIQPLVLHRENDKFVLICGERRFRAMTSLQMEEAPCFILENKTADELLAIQFSENSSREDLHFIDQADSIHAYKEATGISERKIQAALGTSKSEVHRCILIAKLPSEVKEAAKLFNIEKYVLLEWDALEEGEGKTAIKEKILAGKITKRLQLKKAIGVHPIAPSDPLKTTPKIPTVTKPQKPVSAKVFVKAIQSRSKDLDLDENTRKILKDLLKDTQEAVDLT